MTTANLYDSGAKNVNRFRVGDLGYSTSLEKYRGGGAGESRESYTRKVKNSMNPSMICNPLSFPQD